MFLFAFAASVLLLPWCLAEKKVCVVLKISDRVRALLPRDCACATRQARLAGAVKDCSLCLAPALPALSRTFFFFFFFLSPSLRAWLGALAFLRLPGTLANYDRLVGRLLGRARPEERHSGPGSSRFPHSVVPPPLHVRRWAARFDGPDG
ncbi:uncharacterized protein IWZ02DRAFT_185847 [Phyllosticta citriasiana]|uniref:uncharacterized protein n=1 Tax=Phyllosticta citriasiana TaxID=595635 RepID=UPI0030FDE749